MNKEIAMKWADALDSGKYKQGRGGLRDAQDNYCCLGVLCDILEPDGWSSKPSVSTALSPKNPSHYAHSGENTTVLPEKIQRKAAMRSVAGEPSDRSFKALWELNDGNFVGDNRQDSWSFPAIAALIREKWLLL